MNKLLLAGLCLAVLNVGCGGSSDDPETQAMQEGALQGPQGDLESELEAEATEIGEDIESEATELGDEIEAQATGAENELETGVTELGDEIEAQATDAENELESELTEAENELESEAQDLESDIEADTNDEDNDVETAEAELEDSASVFAGGVVTASDTVSIASNQGSRRVTMLRQDADNNGTYELMVEYAYNADGTLSQAVSTYTDDGQEDAVSSVIGGSLAPQSTLLFTYDDNQRVSRVESSVVGPRIPEPKEIEALAGEFSGSEAVVELQGLLSSDETGTSRSDTSYIRDGDGLVLQERTEIFDQAGDLSVIDLVEPTRADGRVVSAQSRFTTVGEGDSLGPVYTRLYDSENRVETVIETDENDVLRRRTSVEYDGDRVARLNQVVPNQPAFNMLTQLTYDSQGIASAIEVTGGAQVTPETVTLRFENNLAILESDLNQDSTIDIREEMVLESGPCLDASTYAPEFVGPSFNLSDTQAALQGNFFNNRCFN